MNKIITGIVTKKAANTVNEAAEKLAELSKGEVVMSKKMFMLEIAVAALGGLVLGMFLSPRKTCTYKIASCNNINSDDDDEGCCGDEDCCGDENCCGDEDDSKNKSKFIKL